MEENEMSERTDATIGEALDAAVAPTQPAMEGEAVDADYLREAEALRAIYPDFDLETELGDPVLGAILRGKGKPTLRQLYEAAHFDRIMDGRVAEAVQSAVTSAVADAVEVAVTDAVRTTEERVLDHIRARGRRPAENGTRAASGIRMHPAVSRLTRRERAMLAKRAENGETVKL